MPSKILIVEDNPQNMRLVEMVLRDQDYNLLQATDGEKALDVARQEIPDLILMDIQLPGMNGLDVTRKLRENTTTSHIPIIGITAYAMKGDREKIMAAGCDAYISKPINTRELPGLVRSILDRSNSNLSE